MKILLPQSTFYVPTHSGENKSNRILLEGLAQKGHNCQVIAPAYGRQGPQTHEHLQHELTIRKIDYALSSGVFRFDLNGVGVHAVAHRSHLQDYIKYQAHEFQPTWIITSATDPGLFFLETSLRVAPARVVHLAQTPYYLPFGPNSRFSPPAKARLFKQITGIIAVSSFVKEYIENWGNLKSTVIHMPVYGRGPFPHFGCFEKGLITMINPSAYKGISIFLELAEHMPETEFAAVPTWATTNNDLANLKRLPNVKIMSPVDNMDKIYAQTRILLVPSLCDEAFGLVCVEAMLRGIPVIASDAGGLPEAKMGIDYTIPVQTITQYQEQADEKGILLPIIPSQTIGPWHSALASLLSDREHYNLLSSASRQAALSFIANVGITPFEEYLQNLPQASQPLISPPQDVVSNSNADRSCVMTLISQLSSEKRMLLTRRLRGEVHNGTI